MKQFNPDPDSLYAITMARKGSPAYEMVMAIKKAATSKDYRDVPDLLRACLNRISVKDIFKTDD